MADFKIYAYTNHDLRSTPRYHESYQVLCKNKACYQCDYFSYLGSMQTTQITDLANEEQSLIFEQKKQVGERLVEVHNLDQELVGFIVGNSILDADKQLLAKVVDPASTAKKLIKNMANMDPNEFYIENETGDRLAEFKRPAPPKGSPLVKLAKVVFAGLTSKETEIFQLGITSWGHNPALLIMLVLLKYQARNQDI